MSCHVIRGTVSQLEKPGNNATDSYIVFDMKVGGTQRRVLSGNLSTIVIASSESENLG